MVLGSMAIARVAGVWAVCEKDGEHDAELLHREHS